MELVRKKRKPTTVLGNSYGEFTIVTQDMIRRIKDSKALEKLYKDEGEN